MAENDAELDGNATEGTEALPHLVTVVGHGVPASFEITVDGAIESASATPTERAVLVSNHAVEGTVEAGVTQFRFSGELANAHLVDRADSPSSPTIHVEYGPQ